MRRIAKQFGKPYPFDVRMKIMGTTEQRSAEIAVTDLKLPLTVDQYLVKYNILCHEMLGSSKLLQGLFKDNILFPKVWLFESLYNNVSNFIWKLEHF